MERKAFSFLRSFYEAAKELPEDQQAVFLMAVCDYAFTGEEPEIHGVAAAMFKLAKPNIDASLKKAAAGSVGGSNKQTASKPQANDKQTASKTEANDKQTESKSEANDKQTESKPQAIKDKGDRIKDKGKEIKEEEEKEEVEEEKTPQKYQPILEAWNDLPLANIRMISGKRLKMLQARIKQYSFEDVLKAIENIHASPFLLGQNQRNWQICFDWFILPNNFTKVLEGNYKEKQDAGGFTEQRIYGDVL